MWKMMLAFILPLITPLEIAYGLAMKVLMPLGVPDYLGIMAVLFFCFIIRYFSRKPTHYLGIMITEDEEET